MMDGSTGSTGSAEAAAESRAEQVEKLATAVLERVRIVRSNVASAIESLVGADERAVTEGSSPPPPAGAFDRIEASLKDIRTESNAIAVSLERLG